MKLLDILLKNKVSKVKVCGTPFSGYTVVYYTNKIIKYSFKILRYDDYKNKWLKSSSIFNSKN